MAGSSSVYFTEDTFRIKAIRCSLYCIILALMELAENTLSTASDRETQDPKRPTQRSLPHTGSYVTCPCDISFIDIRNIYLLCHNNTHTHMQVYTDTIRMYFNMAACALLPTDYILMVKVGRGGDKTHAHRQSLADYLSVLCLLCALLQCRWFGSKQ